MTRPARPLTLALDASAALGTVAVLAGSELLAADETRMRGESGERLLPVALEALRAAGGSLADLGDVVCGDGPGGFTGLRIAAGLAKGLCVARDLPLAAVSSLVLAAAAARPAPGRYLVALDAMRDELFVLEVEVDAAGRISAGSERRMPAREAESYRARGGWASSGSDGQLVVAPHARGVGLLRAQASELIRLVSTDSWEPAYGRKAEAQVKWEATHGRALA